MAAIINDIDLVIQRGPMVMLFEYEISIDG